MRNPTVCRSSSIALPRNYAAAPINLLLQQELKRLEAIISEIKIKPSIELIDK